MAEEKRSYDLDLEAIQSLKLKPRQNREMPSAGKLSGQMQVLPLRPENSFSREVIERLIAWLKES